MPSPKCFAVYDMDLTITRSATLMPFLLHWVSRRAPWRCLMLPLLLPLLALYGLRRMDRAQLKCAMVRLLMGEPKRVHVEAAARSFARKTARGGVFPPFAAHLAAQRKAGATIVIATASFDFYVIELARLWGIDRVIATRSVWQSGPTPASDRLQARIDGENCYGQAKRDRVEAYFAQQGWPTSAEAQISFFSDHHSDLPMFELASTPVAVNPNDRLAVLAAQRGWDILDWR